MSLSYISRNSPDLIEYLQAILMEIQRLCPVVPLGVPHGTTEDVSLNEKWLIPKGTMLMVSHWDLNHDPEKFDSPQKFKPYRFLDEETGRVKKSDNLMPFQVS